MASQFFTGGFFAAGEVDDHAAFALHADSAGEHGARVMHADGRAWPPAMPGTLRLHTSMVVFGGDIAAGKDRCRRRSEQKSSM